MYPLNIIHAYIYVRRCECALYILNIFGSMNGIKCINMIYAFLDMGVSKNRGTPKSSILIGFSITNHPFWGTTIFGNTHIIIPFT